MSRLLHAYQQEIEKYLTERLRSGKIAALDIGEHRQTFYGTIFNSEVVQTQIKEQLHVLKKASVKELVEFIKPTLDQLLIMKPVRENINVSFEVSGTVNQEIHLYGDVEMSDKEFQELLAKGEVLTTVGHSAGEFSPVYLTKDLGNPIGIVVHQNVESDMEFDNFKVFDSEDEQDEN